MFKNLWEFFQSCILIFQFTRNFQKAEKSGRIFDGTDFDFKWEGTKFDPVEDLGRIGLGLKTESDEIWRQLPGIWVIRLLFIRYLCCVCHCVSLCVSVCENVTTASTIRSSSSSSSSNKKKTKRRCRFSKLVAGFVGIPAGFLRDLYGIFTGFLRDIESQPALEVDSFAISFQIHYSSAVTLFIRWCRSASFALS